jgi:membrane protease YdiL (CAAX protease family)
MSSSKRRSLERAAFYCFAFILLVTATNWLAKYFLFSVIQSSLRARVTVELTAAMITEVGILLWAVRRGPPLRDIGFGKPAPFGGWLAAVLVAALFIWFNLALPLSGQRIAEFSLFHVSNALIAAVVAGFVEEALFRGYLIDELRRAGWGNKMQAIISAAAYGVVHAAWGLTSGLFTFQMIGGAVIGTTVFGLFCAAVYLLSRRSLTPVMLCHGAIDLVIEPWLFMVAVRMASGHS